MDAVCKVFWVLPSGIASAFTVFQNALPGIKFCAVQSVSLIKGQIFQSFTFCGAILNRSASAPARILLSRLLIVFSYGQSRYFTGMSEISAGNAGFFSIRICSVTALRAQLFIDRLFSGSGLSSIAILLNPILSASALIRSAVLYSLPSKTALPKIKTRTALTSMP